MICEAIILLLELNIPLAVIWFNVVFPPIVNEVVPLPEIFPRRVTSPTVWILLALKNPLALTLLPVILPVFTLVGVKVATDSVAAVMVPLELILPLDVTLPVMVCISAEALPKVVLPLLIKLFVVRTIPNFTFDVVNTSWSMSYNSLFPWPVFIVVAVKAPTVVGPPLITVSSESNILAPSSDLISIIPLASDFI